REGARRRARTGGPAARQRARAEPGSRDRATEIELRRRQAARGLAARRVGLRERAGVAQAPDVLVDGVPRDPDVRRDLLDGHPLLEPLEHLALALAEGRSTHTWQPTLVSSWLSSYTRPAPSGTRARRSALAFEIRTPQLNVPRA